MADNWAQVLVKNQARVKAEAKQRRDAAIKTLPKKERQAARASVAAWQASEARRPKSGYTTGWQDGQRYWYQEGEPETRRMVDWQQGFAQPQIGPRQGRTVPLPVYPRYSPVNQPPGPAPYRPSGGGGTGGFGYNLPYPPSAAQSPAGQQLQDLTGPPQPGDPIVAPPGADVYDVPAPVQSASPYRPQLDEGRPYLPMITQDTPDDWWEGYWTREGPFSRYSGWARSNKEVQSRPVQPGEQYGVTTPEGIERLRPFYEGLRSGDLSAAGQAIIDDPLALPGAVFGAVATAAQPISTVAPYLLSSPQLLANAKRRIRDSVPVDTPVVGGLGIVAPLMDLSISGDAMVMGDRGLMQFIDDLKGVPYGLAKGYVVADPEFRDAVAATTDLDVWFGEAYRDKGWFEKLRLATEDTVANQSAPGYAAAKRRVGEGPRPEYVQWHTGGNPFTTEDAYWRQTFNNSIEMYRADIPEEVRLLSDIVLDPIPAIPARGMLNFATFGPQNMYRVVRNNVGAVVNPSRNPTNYMDKLLLRGWNVIDRLPLVGKPENTIAYQDIKAHTVLGSGLLTTIKRAGTYTDEAGVSHIIGVMDYNDVVNIQDAIQAGRVLDLESPAMANYIHDTDGGIAMVDLPTMKETKAKIDAVAATMPGGPRTPAQIDQANTAAIVNEPQLMADFSRAVADAVKKKRNLTDLDWQTRIGNAFKGFENMAFLGTLRYVSNNASYNLVQMFFDPHTRITGSIEDLTRLMPGAPVDPRVMDYVNMNAEGWKNISDPIRTGGGASTREYGVSDDPGTFELIAKAQDVVRNVPVFKQYLKGINYLASEADIKNIPIGEQAAYSKIWMQYYLDLKAAHLDPNGGSFGLNADVRLMPERPPDMPDDVANLVEQRMKEGIVPFGDIVAEVEDVLVARTIDVNAGLDDFPHITGVSAEQVRAALDEAYGPLREQQASGEWLQDVKLELNLAREQAEKNLMEIRDQYLDDLARTEARDSGPVQVDEYDAKGRLSEMTESHAIPEQPDTWDIVASATERYAQAIDQLLAFISDNQGEAFTSAVVMPSYMNIVEHWTRSYLGADNMLKSTYESMKTGTPGNVAWGDYHDGIGSHWTNRAQQLDALVQAETKRIQSYQDGTRQVPSDYNPLLQFEELVRQMDEHEIRDNVPASFRDTVIERRTEAMDNRMRAFMEAIEIFADSGSSKPFARYIAAQAQDAKNARVVRTTLLDAHARMMMGDMPVADYHRLREELWGSLAQDSQKLWDDMRDAMRQDQDPPLNRIDKASDTQAIIRREQRPPALVKAADDARVQTSTEDGVQFDYYLTSFANQALDAAGLELIPARHPAGHVMEGKEIANNAEAFRNMTQEQNDVVFSALQERSALWRRVDDALAEGKPVALDEDQARVVGLKPGTNKPVFWAADESYWWETQLLKKQINSYENAMTKTAFKKKLASSFGYSGKMVRVITDLNDAAAKVWARATNQNARDYYKAHYYDIVKGMEGLTVEEQTAALKQDMEKNMIALHNLSPSNLLVAMDVGGIPVPSMHLRRKELGPLHGYGTITAVGHVDMIDPARGKAQVYSNDAYTHGPAFLSGRKRLPEDEGGIFGEIREYAEKWSLEDELFYAMDEAHGGTDYITDDVDMRYVDSEQQQMFVPAVDYWWNEWVPAMTDDGWKNTHQLTIREFGEELERVFDESAGDVAEVDPRYLSDMIEHYDLAELYQRWTDESLANTFQTGWYFDPHDISKRATPDTIMERYRSDLDEIWEYEEGRGTGLEYGDVRGTQEQYIGTPGWKRAMRAERLEDMAGVRRRGAQTTERAEYEKYEEEEIIPSLRELENALNRSGFIGIDEDLIAREMGRGWSDEMWDELVEDNRLYYGDGKFLMPEHVTAAELKKRYKRTYNALKRYADVYAKAPSGYLEAKIIDVVPLNEWRGFVVPIQESTFSEIVGKLRDAGVRVEEYDMDIPGDRERAVASFWDHPGVLYQRDVERAQKKMYAQHNLTARGLQVIFDIKGSPGTSVAVLPEGIPWDETAFGDISLFKRGGITQEEARLYSGDAWTQTMPRVDMANGFDRVKGNDLLDITMEVKDKYMHLFQASRHWGADYSADIFERDSGTWIEAGNWDALRNFWEYQAAIHYYFLNDVLKVSPDVLRSFEQAFNEGKASTKQAKVLEQIYDWQYKANRDQLDIGPMHIDELVDKGWIQSTTVREIIKELQVEKVKAFNREYHPDKQKPATDPSDHYDTGEDYHPMDDNFARLTVVEAEEVIQRIKELAQAGVLQDGITDTSAGDAGRWMRGEGHDYGVPWDEKDLAEMKEITPQEIFDSLFEHKQDTFRSVFDAWMDTLEPEMSPEHTIYWEGPEPIKDDDGNVIVQYGRQEATPEVIAAIMRKEGGEDWRGNTGGFSVKRALWRKEFKDVEEMREYAHKNVYERGRPWHEALDSWKKELNDAYDEIYAQIEDDDKDMVDRNMEYLLRTMYGGDPGPDYNRARARLMRSIKSKIDDAFMLMRRGDGYDQVSQIFWRNLYPDIHPNSSIKVNLSRDAYAKMEAVMEKWQNRPEDMFEAKVIDWIPLDQWDTAVVPNHIDGSQLRKMEELGWEVLIFDSDAPADAPNGRITMLKKAMSNPGVQFQDAHAAVKFEEDGRAFIMALQEPNFSSFIHEYGHVLRRQLQRMAAFDEGAASDYKAAQEYYGVVDDRWTTQQEESWAKDFEVYAATNQAPTPELASLFERMAEFMANVYNSIKARFGKNDIAPEIRAIFDRLLANLPADHVSKTMREVADRPQPHQVEPKNVRVDLDAAQADAAARDIDLYKPAPEQIGNMVKGWTDPTRQFNMRYEIIPESEIIGSNLPDGRVNPAYHEGSPPGMQPHDRSLPASITRRDEIAQKHIAEEALGETTDLNRGTQIIDKNNKSLSGSLRKMIWGVLSPEKKQKYYDMLRAEAPSRGIDPSVVDDIEAAGEEPNLIRRLMDDVDLVEFAKDANTDVGTGYNPTEVAAMIENVMKPQDFQVLEHGSATSLQDALTAARNKGFVTRVFKRVPNSEKGRYLDADGVINRDGVELMRGVLWHGVFGDNPGLMNLVVSADPDIKNIMRALDNSIIDLNRLEAQIDMGILDPALSIADDLATAVEEVRNVKALDSQYESVQQRIHQTGFFKAQDLTEPVKLIMEVIDTNIRSAKKIAEFIDEYTTRVIKYGKAGQLDTGVQQVDKMRYLNEAASGGQMALLQAKFQTPRSSDAARSTMQGQDYDLESLRRWLQDYDPTAPREDGLTPADAARIRQQVIDTYGQADAQASIAASRAATYQAEAKMTDYGDRRHFDKWLDLIFPYHYWYTRQTWNWIQRIMRRPGLLLAWLSWQRYLREKREEDKGLRPRFDDKWMLDLDKLGVQAPKDMNGDTFLANESYQPDPATSMIPFSNVIHGTDWNDPEEANIRWLAEVESVLGRLGFMPHAPYQYAVNEIQGRPQQGWRDFTALGDFIQGLSVLARPAFPENIRPGPGGIWFGKGQWDFYLLQRTLASMAAEEIGLPGVEGEQWNDPQAVLAAAQARGQVDLELLVPYLDAQRKVEDWNQGRAQPEEIDAIKDDPMIATALNRTGIEMAIPDVTGFFSSFTRMRMVQEGEKQQVATQSAERALGYNADPEKGPINLEGSRADVLKVRAGTEYGRARQAQYGAIPGEREQEAEEAYWDLTFDADKQNIQNWWDVTLTNLATKDPANHEALKKLRKERADKYDEAEAKVPKEFGFEAWQADLGDEPYLWSVAGANPEEVIQRRAEQITAEIYQTRPQYDDYVDKDDPTIVDWDKMMDDRGEWEKNLRKIASGNKVITAASKDLGATQAEQEAAVRELATPEVMDAWSKRRHDPMEALMEVVWDEYTKESIAVIEARERKYGKDIMPRLDAYYADRDERYGSNISERLDAYYEGRDKELPKAQEQMDAYYKERDATWDLKRVNALGEKYRNLKDGDKTTAASKKFLKTKDGKYLLKYWNWNPSERRYNPEQYDLMQKKYGQLFQWWRVQDKYAQQMGVADYLEGKDELQETHGLTDYFDNWGEFDDLVPEFKGGPASKFIAIVLSTYPDKGWTREQLLALYEQVSDIPNKERVRAINEAEKANMTLAEWLAEEKADDVPSKPLPDDPGADDKKGKKWRKRGYYRRYGSSGYRRSYYRRSYGGGGYSRRPSYYVPRYRSGGTRRDVRIR